MPLRIVSATLMLLLVPAFSQVLSAQFLLSCADGRPCAVLPPVSVSTCKTQTFCRHQTSPKVPVDRGSRCVWTMLPGLDLNHSIYRTIIAEPALLPIARRDLLAMLTAPRLLCFGQAVEHV